MDKKILRLPKKQFNETIELNQSKSIKIRYLILEFIFFNRLLKVNENDPEDVKIVHNLLRIIQEKRNKNSHEITIIDVKDCGSAYRYLLSVLAITKGKWLLTGNERLLQRPVNQLVKSLINIGAEIENSKTGIYITGKELKARYIAIDSSESSQFATSLLLLSQQIGLEKIVFTNSDIVSSSYIRMTCRILQDYGIDTIVEQDNISITLPEDVQKANVQIESDWSAAIFWYALAVLSEEAKIELNNLKLNSYQGDAIIVNWFEKSGIKTEKTDRGILLSKISRNSITELEFDLKDNPDLAPVLAVLGALLPVKLTLSGLKTLNSKESRRFDIIIEELSGIAPVSFENNEKIVINGAQKITQKKSPLVFDSHQDHRFVMAFSLISLFHDSIIQGIDCVKKSYPDFLKHFKQIGGEVRPVNSPNSSDKP